MRYVDKVLDLVPRQGRREREPRLTPLAVLQLKATAWLADHAANAEVRLLEARRRVAAACVNAEQVTDGLALTREVRLLAARQRLAEATVDAEDAEDDLALRRNLRQGPVEQRREILGHAAEVERLLLERERFRAERRFGSALPPGPAPSAPAPALDWAISDRQIEVLALRAVTQFQALPPEERERAWAAWRRELGLRLPPYAASEVARRAQALCDLAR